MQTDFYYRVPASSGGVCQEALKRFLHILNRLFAGDVAPSHLKSKVLLILSGL